MTNIITCAKERPIPFSASMVRALLAGTKTQTRRAIKAPDSVSAFHHFHEDKWDRMQGGQRGDSVRCPYGQPGDRLWVREAWKAHTTFDHLPPRDIPESHVWYMADDGYKAESRHRQGMFMPRWASRITLEVTEVRVERLQDISEADAQAEGVYTDPACPAYDAYAQLWDEINGAGSWAANPWVWAITFKRVGK